MVRRSASRRPHALDEKLHRFRVGDVGALDRQAQALDPEPEQAVDQRGTVARDLLTVVEHQQRAAAAQMAADGRGSILARGPRYA